MAQKELTPHTEIKSISIQKPTIANPYITAATSNNTRKAYRSDIRHFEQWGGKLPASIDSIISYLQAYAETLNPRTLSRRLTALKQWHIYQGFPDPTQHPAIRKTLTGIMRIHGRPKEKSLSFNPRRYKNHRDFSGERRFFYSSTRCCTIVNWFFWCFSSQ